MADVRRFLLASGMNLLVPGTGLIALGRAWLGVALAAWFALGAEVALCAALIAPMSIPRWITVTAGVLAGIAWLAGQGLLINYIRLLRDPSLPADLKALRDLAKEALERGDLGAARISLRLALSIDDSDLPTRVLWARLLSRKGRRSKARRAWLEAQQLDEDEAYATEIRQGLEGG
jgi:tetratricopeptide (TPR) repeat protein